MNRRVSPVVKISSKKVPEKEIRTDALILPFFEDHGGTHYSEIDEAIGGLIRRAIGSKEFIGKQNQTTLLHVTAIPSARVLLVGLGKQPELTTERLRQAGGTAFSFLQKTGVPRVALSTRILDNHQRGFKASQKPSFYFMEGGLLSLYRFEKYKKPENGKEMKSVTLLGEGGDFPRQWLETTVSATVFARDLVNTPANEMTPTALETIARSFSDKRITVKTLEKKDAERVGMGAYLSVARGSAEPPKFIVIQYIGGKGSPLVLIGKSITFDSGGLSIKPSEGMEKMKYDMAGGAAVLAVMKAAAELEIPLHVVGVLPATENLPSGSASKPGDVVRTITGKTVEIITTDAEGRLILADAIGYALKYLKPRAIIDIATLTGACSVAFGNEAIAMMGNDGGLMEALKKASDETSERVWQMPLYEEYKEYLKSDVADLKNSGGRSGSLLAAGYFLKEFAGDLPWVHLDIAGTALTDKDKPYIPKGATGVGARLFLTFLKESYQCFL